MKPEYIILHTAAFKGDADISLIKQWHLQRGFNDVGYHYYIRRSGQIQQGRKENINGAHCRDMGMNRKSLGICFEGHHNFEDWTPQQIESFYPFIKELLEKYSIPVENILGHRETGANKDCPGTKIDMNQVRNKILNFK